ncbi:MAG: aminopeptidase [Bacteroidetes bacterium GWC2_33_15]|nr:MAG: aminopeptidase [Bacteroidetes bacterium GWA2_33_15]OFX51566.1 MAG: aminopeptidase [Bacteroidetes bacterium GWC2_33_15]OFX63364.1 MAG: aminopeptidase [Bacteroidetes bacterium GWB2_32_14]OFX68036.1 MAG: aminopeptidase [Bacteroidetes bacterium GWD2_33_33]HAN17145.1 aminopeptidase [Bacteroidales bacterium]
MNKKLIAYIAILLLANGTLSAQENTGKKSAYQFTVVKEIRTTPVKDQNRSGTCWSFSTISFLESEMLRMGKPEVNLSEAWVVRHSYSDKAKLYVRWQGSLNFAGGGGFHDVTNCIKKYGIVPEEVYAGLNYGTEKFVHNEMDAVLKAYMDQVIKNPNKELSTAWHNGLEGILDAYLGEKVEKFTYNGKEYTPKTFAAEYVGINPDDYIEVTSFTHHPYYTKFILELPDNWSFDEVYNVTLDDFIQIIDNSIEMGYTVAWGGDVSEKGFSWKNGVAIVPDIKYEETSGSDKERLTGLTAKEKDEILYSFEKQLKELEITPELRQKEFDNYNTTDDHGMHIVGIAKDQNGNKFYKVKNSWDIDNPYNGYIFMSEAFIKFKATDIMIHKNGIPKEIAKKLGL